MKSWKLGAILVASLVLLAGLYSGAASAELMYGSANVSTTPEVVIDENTATLRVTYRFDGAPLDDNNIIVTLPVAATGTAAWEAAYTDFGTLASDAIDLEGDSTTDPVRMVSSLGAGESPRSTSYVTVDYMAAGSSAYKAMVSIGSTVTITKFLQM